MSFLLMAQVNNVDCTTLILIYYLIIFNNVILIYYNNIAYYFIIILLQYRDKLQGNIFYRAMNFFLLPFAFLVSGDVLSGEVKKGTNRNDLFKTFPRNRNFALGRARAKKDWRQKMYCQGKGQKEIWLLRGEKFARMSRNIFQKFAHTLLKKLKQILITM